MQIKINDRDNFWDELVTVQKKDKYGTVLWCNHANVFTEEGQTEYVSVHGPDMVQRFTVIICDKCGAHRFDDDNFWEDAPEQGVSYA